MAPPRARDYRRVCALLLPLVTSACLAVPDIGAEPQLRPASLDAASFAAPSAEWPEQRWWQRFGDPQLAALIEQGLAGAPSQAEAQARVRRALAAAQQSGSRLKPSLDGSAEAGIFNQSFAPGGWQDDAQASVGLGLDLDLWGKNRASLRAALSEADAARADSAFASLAISTSIAAAYADLLRLAEIRKTSETLLRIRAETVATMRAREGQGLENRAAVLRSESSRAAAAADLAAIDEQIDLTRNALAALIGDGPARARSIQLPKGIRSQGFGLPADTGIDIVGRRPDIVAARLRVESGRYREKAAKAEFFPNIRLSALIGLQSFGIENLLGGSASGFGSAGPAVSLPLFSGGRIEGGYRSARAEREIAIAAYHQAIVDALREIADVEVRQRALRVRLAESRAAKAASESAYRMIQARYRGGLATYLEVLSAEDSYNSNCRAVAELEASAFALEVALVRALGGGFHSPTLEGPKS